MKILNKKAKFDYNLFDIYEAGITLNGAEVKAIRAGKVDLSRAYVKEMGDQLFLVNANIGVIDENEATRSRKLLLHRKEILNLILQKKAKQLTFIPLKLYNKGRLIKLEFATAKGKRKYEKRETLKKRDIEREHERELKF